MFLLPSLPPSGSYALGVSIFQYAASGSILNDLIAWGRSWLADKQRSTKLVRVAMVTELMIPGSEHSVCHIELKL